MPKLIGTSTRVVDHGGTAIDELVGNVASKDDRISIAHVNVSEATAEPWLTLHYDEWICVLQGPMELHHSDGSILTLQTGETCFVPKGQRFRPVFPEAGVEYIPVCVPAFRPDRCIREEETESDISIKLRELHSGNEKAAIEGSAASEADAATLKCRKVGSRTRAVELPTMTIDELAGNTSTKDDTLSIAYVTITDSMAEPWLTLDYDEWICVFKGVLELRSPDGSVLTVPAGKTALVSKGEQFKPVMSDAGTVFVSVCIPAFRPDRCVRADEASAPAEPDKLYHMCQKSLWEQAVASKTNYFPPTYEADGCFTHATAIAARLLETANHFYTGVAGEWICLELSRSALTEAGIITRFEEAKPVGEKQVRATWREWRCPHIFGGIPPQAEGVVTLIHPIVRDEKGNFLSIEGVTDSLN